MESNNASQSAAADRDIAAAARYSRYLQRLLAADPAIIRETEVAQPFTAEAMQAELSTSGITDGISLGRALRRLRQRVMARLIVRDLSRRAELIVIRTSC